MSEELNKETIVETTETKAEPEVKKQRKPRTVVRPLAELMELPEKKLNDAEKNLLIKKLKEEVNLKTNQFKACQEVTDSAFAQNNQLQEDYKNMEAFYQEKLKYVNAQLKAFSAAINMAIKGGIQ